MRQEDRIGYCSVCSLFLLPYILLGFWVSLTVIGTDHPFFPPLDGKEDETWLSVTTNYKAIDETLAGDADAIKAVLGGNAVRILNLR